jgi:hypothetical protein
MKRDTTVCSISAEHRQKIKADTTNIDFIMGYRDDTKDEWLWESYGFQFGLENLVGILRDCGYEKTAFSFDVENFVHLKNEEYLTYTGGDFWFIAPSRIKEIVLELQDATDKQLKIKGLAKGITDTSGNLITEENYHEHIGFGELKKFLNDAARKREFLMFYSWIR